VRVTFNPQRWFSKGRRTPECSGVAPTKRVSICEYRLLGEGGTHRSLPFWDEIRESISMRQLIDNQWVLYKAQAAAATPA